MEEAARNGAREAAVLRTATGVGIDGGAVGGGGIDIGVGEEESLAGVAASVAGGQKEERRGTASALGVGGGEEEERRGDPERQGRRWRYAPAAGVRVGNREGISGGSDLKEREGVGAMGCGGERWVVVTMVEAGAAMWGRHDD
uniref:DUF834 domain-containing protein n=1 Tax=Oryza meridionalis TaxID=40149 RepID=A0A0E0CLN0_9ORYZ